VGALVSGGDPFDFAVNAALDALVAGRAPTVAEMDPRGEMDTCLLVLAASRARDEHHAACQALRDSTT